MPQELADRRRAAQADEPVHLGQPRDRGARGLRKTGDQHGRRVVAVFILRRPVTNRGRQEESVHQTAERAAPRVRKTDARGQLSGLPRPGKHERRQRVCWR